jgi:acyl-CoA-binding protein
LKKRDPKEVKNLVQAMYDMAVDKVDKALPTMSSSEKLTMYSLYKQINEGNAPTLSDYNGPSD